MALDDRKTGKVTHLRWPNQEYHVSGDGGDPPMDDLRERLIRIETTLPTLATKADVVDAVGSLRSEMHGELGKLRGDVGDKISSQTWKFVTWVTGLFVTVGGALTAAVYYIARNVS